MLELADFGFIYLSDKAPGCDQPTAGALLAANR